MSSKVKVKKKTKTKQKQKQSQRQVVNVNIGSNKRRQPQAQTIRKPPQVPVRGSTSVIHNYYQPPNSVNRANPINAGAGIHRDNVVGGVPLWGDNVADRIRARYAGGGGGGGAGVRPPTNAPVAVGNLIDLGVDNSVSSRSQSITTTNSQPSNPSSLSNSSDILSSRSAGAESLASTIINPRRQAPSPPASLASTIVRQQTPLSSISTDSSLFDTSIVSATESQGSYESLPSTIRPPPTLASTIVSRNIARSENEEAELPSRSELVQIPESMSSRDSETAVGIAEIENRIGGAGGIRGAEIRNRQIDLSNMRNNQLKQDANTQLQRHQARRGVDVVESGLRNLERDIDNYIRTAGRNIPVNSQLSQRDNPSSLAQDETPTPVQAEFRSVEDRADRLLTPSEASYRSIGVGSGVVGGSDVGVDEDIQELGAKVLSNIELANVEKKEKREGKAPIRRAMRDAMTELQEKQGGLLTKKEVNEKFKRIYDTLQSEEGSVISEGSETIPTPFPKPRGRGRQKLSAMEIERNQVREAERLLNRAEVEQEPLGRDRGIANPNRVKNNRGIGVNALSRIGFEESKSDDSSSSSSSSSSGSESFSSSSGGLSTRLGRNERYLDEATIYPSSRSSDDSWLREQRDIIRLMDREAGSSYSGGSTMGGHGYEGYDAYRYGSDTDSNRERNWDASTIASSARTPDGDY